MAEFAHFEARGEPPTSLCLRCFLVSEGEEGLLVGRVKRAAEWQDLEIAHGFDALLESGQWVLPASHLLVGETPAAAARRIATQQLGATSHALKEASAFSHISEQPGHASPPRWNLCFVFEAQVQLAGTPPWFDELKRIPLRYLNFDLFAPEHGFVAADMGLLPAGNGR